MAGILFAVHPVGVESVAWISEQKQRTLSTALALWAALAYLAFDERHRQGGWPDAWAMYAGATVLFSLALLSKTVTASSAAPSLLLIRWWRHGRVALEAERTSCYLAPWIRPSATAGLAVRVDRAAFRRRRRRGFRLERGAARRFGGKDCLVLSRQAGPARRPHFLLSPLASRFRNGRSAPADRSPCPRRLFLG